jgi:protein SCO1/2
MVKPASQIMLLITVCLLVPLRPAGAESNTLPPELEDVGFDQRLGEWVPLDLMFIDATGREAPLSSWFGERPVILALVYYDCPMLCPMVLNGLTSALKPMNFNPGEEFEIVVVSFDSRETTAMAAESKATFVGRYGRPGTEAGWHFLTGSEENIAALTEAVGFRFSYDPEIDQFAHTAGIVALTPEGQIARYFYGVDYPPKTLRLGLVEAADNKIGSIVDQVLLYCYHYDPATGTYTAVAMNIMRLGALVTVALLGLFLLIQLKRERRAAAAEV